MTNFGRRFVPRSLRGQLMGIILLAMLVIIVIGSAFERATDNDYVPNMEIIAERGGVVAGMLRETPPEGHGPILTAARAAGLDFRILGKEQAGGTPSSAQRHSVVGSTIGALFPPE
ncbi:sensor histidine kinase, partial [Rhizobiaceae sp. 2RAB30]